jgi:hypothetical protein
VEEAIADGVGDRGVGSYAEGSSEVEVPYGVLRPYLSRRFSRLLDREAEVGRPA